MDYQQLLLLCFVAGFVCGCASGPIPPISLEHFSDTAEFGSTVTPPRSGGSGPPLVELTFDPVTDDLAIPQRLPELAALYRSRLVADAHHLEPEQAQQFAELQVAQLERMHADDGSALRAALLRRLRPAGPVPGRAVNTFNGTPVYPDEERRR